MESFWIKIIPKKGKQDTMKKKYSLKDKMKKKYILKDKMKKKYKSKLGAVSK